MKHSTTSHEIPLFTIGIDLGDTRHSVCVLDRTGEVVGEFTIANDENSLVQLCRQYPDARVAFEVGTHSPWVSRLMQEQNIEVYVANARKLRPSTPTSAKATPPTP